MKARFVISNNSGVLEQKIKQEKGIGNAPYLMREESEPRDVEQNGEEKQNGVSSAKALTATLNCDKSEQSNGQINQQNTIVQCSKRSNQSAANLEKTSKRSISTILRPDQLINYDPKIDSTNKQTNSSFRSMKKLNSFS